MDVEETLGKFVEPIPMPMGPPSMSSAEAAAEHFRAQESGRYERFLRIDYLYEDLDDLRRHLRTDEFGVVMDLPGPLVQRCKRERTPTAEEELQPV
jgi:hypothetical protein